MIPFYTRFPELAARETRCVHVVAPGSALPVGEYGFIEFYCDDPGCDCRRVLLQVTQPQAPQTLATINYGWESAEFYTRWMHGDAQAGREITEACLDPLTAVQSPTPARRVPRADDDRPAYVARLARHYEMFRPPADPAGIHPHNLPVWRNARNQFGGSIHLRLISRPLRHDHRRNPPTTPARPRQSRLRSLRNRLLAAGEQRDAITPELIAPLTAFPPIRPTT